MLANLFTSIIPFYYPFYPLLKNPPSCSLPPSQSRSLRSPEAATLRSATLHSACGYHPCYAGIRPALRADPQKNTPKKEALPNTIGCNFVQAFTIFRINQGEIGPKLGPFHFRSKTPPNPAATFPSTPVLPRGNDSGVRPFPRPCHAPR
jgi:hypothetical protein